MWVGSSMLIPGLTIPVVWGRIELRFPRGPVAQLGARFHGMEEVVGSIPTRSTKLSHVSSLLTI
jgi:hypothetical protein